MKPEQPTRRLALAILGAAGAELVGCGSDDEPLQNTGGTSAGEAATAGTGGGSPTDAGATSTAGSTAASGGQGSTGGSSAGGTAQAGDAGSTDAAGAGGEAGGAPATAECTTKPAQTLGPYPNKDNLNRSDIRAGQAGTVLRLRLRVLSAVFCMPISDATVELWQCNALGNYSEYSDFGTAEQHWLRGYQVTGQNGAVDFVTIYPGWYPGRSVHLHFRIKRAGQADFASQLYFEDALSDEVLSSGPYTAHAGTRPRNEDDSIFLAGGGDLTLSVGRSGAELSTTFELGV